MLAYCGYVFHVDFSVWRIESTTRWIIRSDYVAYNSNDDVTIDVNVVYFVCDYDALSGYRVAAFRYSLGDPIEFDGFGSNLHLGEQ